jgi:Flp pilus assembly protein TadG
MNLNHHTENPNRTPACPRTDRPRERGQVLIMFVCFSLVLLLFVGLGIDLGFAYITQARLSKALDAAALAGMDNYYQGTTQAISIAKATFAANFAPNTNDAPAGYIFGNTPVPSIAFSNVSPNVYLTVSASATNHCFFLGVIQPWLKTVAVNTSAQATRFPLVMTLVLDHSGSMDPVGGSTQGGLYMPSAVSSFIHDFDPAVDQAAVISFGSTWTNDVPMTGSFQTVIPPAVSAMQWGGGTCSICGLTNAMLLENSVGGVGSVVKAVVFFTDGLANMIQATSSCPTGAKLFWNFGGYLPSQGTEDVPVFTNTLPATTVEQAYGNLCTVYNPYQYGDQNPCCNAGTFQMSDGTWQRINADNIVDDATNRCINVARQMQEAGMYVFCVGLDNAGNGDVPDPDFLQTLANDPSNPNPDHYIPSLPSGVALITGNGGDLGQLFQLIAAQIQLRLTH